MAAELFDRKLRSLRRDRAYRHGPELFLLERAFHDCLERLSFIARDFRSALLIGCPDPAWPHRLRAHAETVHTIDPGALFAAAARGVCADEDRWSAPPASYDLCMALGTLDTVNDLPAALRAIRTSMRDDSLLIGVIAGGDTLPQLRAALFAADRLMGSAAPHLHPRIDGPTFAELLRSSGFVMPVVDIDRVSLSYRTMAALVSDLRAMAATNVLNLRDRRPMSRSARRAAEQAFADAGDGQRTVEQIELLHFAAWTPANAHS